VLVELAVGDAYGAGFEYVSADLVRARNDLSGYYAHPRHAIAPGCYTDDTQLSLAIAEALVDGIEWTPLALASKFVEVYRRDPREGYASGFHDFLSRVTSGEQFVAEIRPHSDKSGAAMRACPVGVLPDLAEVIERTRIQAAITHDTADGIGAACAAALMPHYFLYERGPRADLGRFLSAHVPGDWASPWYAKVGAAGWMSVRAAITAVQEASSLADLLRRCIALTGDVDTVATIALAAGSCAEDLPADLPDILLTGLESGPFGRPHLAALDARLMSLIET
jgi:ADP-ribosyl-[dinitrogen reductase] hydrolase